MFGVKNERAGRQWADPKLGVSHFKKGIEKIQQHETSVAHKQAEKTFLMTKFRVSQDSTVVAELLGAERAQIERNRKILHRLIDSPLF